MRQGTAVEVATSAHAAAEQILHRAIADALRAGSVPEQVAVESGKTVDQVLAVADGVAELDAMF